MLKKRGRKPKFEVIGVGELPLIFGLWHNHYNDMLGKNVLIVNRKGHKIMGLITILEPPKRYMENTLYERG